VGNCKSGGRKERRRLPKGDSMSNGWIEQKAKDREENQRRQAIIDRGAEDLWTSLKQSVMASAQQYAKRFPQNVEPFDFIHTSPVDGYAEIWIEGVMGLRDSRVGQLAEPKRKITIRIDREHWAIEAHYQGSQQKEIALTIGVAPNNTSACLMLKSEEIDIDWATQTLLLPFLFPDLEPTKL
jgi:hypothetical protein